LRGYSGYYVVEEDETGTTTSAYRGSSGFAINTELAFDRIVKLKKARKLKSIFDLDTYLFADAGSINFENSAGNSEWSSFRADAGVGVSLKIKRFWKFYNIKPLTLRFDVPFYVSHAPASEKNIQFRWVLGINKAF